MTKKTQPMSFCPENYSIFSPLSPISLATM
uniref:Uncharacterized protein n=1 Tax=Anguilla anguilla TaxID=7936 RepID=A0A0E9U1E4_ANGAN